MEVKQWQSSDADANPLGLRHRLYGVDLPAVDIDFLLCEYNRNRAVALIEYKHCSAGEDRMHWDGRDVPRVLTKSAIVTLRNLAERARLPLLVAFYDPDSWRYDIYELFDGRGFSLKNECLTELEFVRFLYKLRGMKMPEELHGKLNS
jgi:hypothetical protein